MVTRYTKCKIEWRKADFRVSQIYERGPRGRIPQVNYDTGEQYYRVDLVEVAQETERN